MEDIISNLRSPSWWFTAVLIGVIASVTSAFIKDYLERKLGVFLAWSQHKRDSLKQERQRILDKWSSSESLLTIALLRMLYAIVILMSECMILGFYVTILRINYNTALTTHVLSFMQITYIIFGAVSLIWLSFHALSRIFLVQECFRRFREARDLPRLFVDDDDV
jgi:hypothetical protein